MTTTIEIGIAVFSIVIAAFIVATFFFMYNLRDPKYIRKPDQQKDPKRKRKNNSKKI